MPISLREFGYKMKEEQSHRQMALKLAIETHGVDEVFNRLNTLEKYDNIQKFYGNVITSDIQYVRTFMGPKITCMAVVFICIVIVCFNTIWTQRGILIGEGEGSDILRTRN